MRSLDHINVGIYEKAFPSTITWPERLAIAAQAGFNFVEISIDENDFRLERLDWGPWQRAELRETISCMGIPIASMCLSAHRKYPMGSASAEIRHKSLDIVRKAIDLAGDIGTRIVLVPGYDVFYEPSDEGTRKRFLEGLHQALIWASGAGVMLALENTERSITSITQAMWYVRQMNSSWLQLYADIGNLNAWGHDVLAELEAGAGHLAGIHVKDTLVGEFRYIPFGKGTVPFVKVFRKLWEIGFSGPIMLEMWAEDDANPLKTISEARSWIQTRIEESRRGLPI